ncbi:hypothetical protein [Gimesia panareensis]|uniref:hypothetical protein n=1 Tax=Gimesia panareensis TaxID=2527978 RepID=UPI00118AD6AD|nr:hypothetical protein [Gimesia panareensis]QDU51238.1 hypothetical protein Pan110_36020 [Gimesia panareensis]
MIQNQSDFIERETRQIKIRLQKTLGDIEGCRHHYLLEAIPGMMPVVEQVIQEFMAETKNSVEFAHAQEELQHVNYDADDLARLVSQYAAQPQMQIALKVAYETWKNAPGSQELLRQIVDHADSISSSGSETFTSSQAPT